MPQIFHRSTNTISKLSIFGAVFILSGLGWVGDRISRSPYATEAGLAREQPVPFSHEHHVNGLGLDCRYCHTSVEESSFAGVPATKICMNCHAEMWTQSPTLEPVRESFRTGQSIVWTRVHRLPEYVYFDHSIHIHKGIGCESCHGRIDRMPLTWQVASLQMDWCLSCHRNPELFIRPRDKVFSMGWMPDGDQRALGTKLVQEYKVRSVRDLTSCSTCHR